MMMTKNYNIRSDCRGMYEDEIIETILRDRGIDNPEHFFHPTEDDMLPLTDLRNIGRATEILNTAIANSKKIGIFYDVDTDGITAGTIMTRYLRNFVPECHIHTYINEGKQHGLASCQEDFSDIDLLIIVDSLDNTVEYYKRLTKQGIDIIVLDHHAINSDNPYDDYVTLVSSQRNYRNPNLSGAGVTWKFCKYLDCVYFTSYSDELADLAACGLIGDMMDMTNMENRYIVSKGLEKIYNPALKKIIGGYEFNSTAISFSIAPIVNAANRMFKNKIAMEAFLADGNKEVLSYIKELKKCKESQNEVVAEYMPDAERQCEEMKDKNMLVVFNDIQYGVNGLIANKLLEKYQRPILVLKDIGDSYAGSMRAVGVDDFRKICNDSGLAQADGHELASGITIKKENYDAFVDYIDKNLHLDLKEEIDVDVQLDVEDITRALIEKIKVIDRISGTGHKPVKVLVDNIDEYGIGQMSDYKHLVVKPKDYLLMIKWNYRGSFEDMEDHCLVNDELSVVGTLDMGWLAKKFVLKLICDDIEVM